MKICQVCNQKYVDDNLNYCLNDGGILIFEADDAPPTVTFKRVPTTRQNWENFQTPTPWQNQPLQQNQTYQPLPPNQSHQQLARQIDGQNRTLPAISLVLGIFAILFTCCWGGVPFGAAALVTGYLGLKNDGENPLQFGGRGLAIGGIVTGVIGLLISIIFFIAIMAG